MIIYKEILEKLKASGYSTARLRKEKLLSESVIQRIRTGAPITTETLNKICELTGLPLEQIVEYKE